MTIFLRRLFACLFLLLAPAAAFAAEKTIIILDASGSMWGKIDGKPKLEIARQTLRAVLQSVPADTELGLIAYGHREKGSCADIEMVVAPAQNTAGAINTAVSKMKFLGRTPLSAAVQRAAEELRTSEDKANVILITDGLETCKADPCAVAAELKKSAIGLTVHVVGFGLSAAEGKQVACVAENTGGKYFPASDAKGLEDALKRTVAAAPQPKPAPAAPKPAPAAPKPAPNHKHHPGLELMPDVALEPTGQNNGLTVEHVAELEFPKEGTIEQCKASCESDKLCAAWRYEPKGSFFVNHARCFRFDYALEADYRFYDPSEGWASGMKKDARLLVRPFSLDETKN